MLYLKTSSPNLTPQLLLLFGSFQHFWRLQGTWLVTVQSLKHKALEGWVLCLHRTLISALRIGLGTK